MRVRFFFLLYDDNWKLFSLEGCGLNREATGMNVTTAVHLLVETCGIAGKRDVATAFYPASHVATIGERGGDVATTLYCIINLACPIHIGLDVATASHTGSHLATIEAANLDVATTTHVDRCIVGSHLADFNVATATQLHHEVATSLDLRSIKVARANECDCIELWCSDPNVDLAFKAI